MDWPATAAAFSNYLLTNGKSRDTARTYAASLHVFNVWADDHELRIESAPREAIEAYIAHELSGRAANTARNRLFAVRSFYDFLISRGVRLDNPTKDLKVKKPKVYPREPVVLQDMRRLAYGAHTRRDMAIVLLLASTGIRIGELVKMQIPDVRQDGTILIRGKGSKDRLVCPGEEVMALVQQVIGERHKGPVWLTQEGKPLTRDRARKNFYRLAERQGVHAYPHKLRVTFANTFLGEGGDLAALQSAMGHSDISTTAHYAKATEQERGLRFMAQMNLGGRIL